MISKTDIENRFRKSLESYEENAYAQKVIVRRLVALIEAYCPSAVDMILEVGCGTGLLTTQIQQKIKYNRLFINDLVDAMCCKTASRCRLPLEWCRAGDIEQIALEEEFDLIVSASTFQWLSCPEDTFRRLFRQIRPGGWLVFSTFGEDNYKELKCITKSGLVYHSILEMTDLLPAEFEILHIEESHQILEFDSPLEVLKHIKNTGVNATGPSQSWTRGKLEEFVKEYTAFVSKDGQYPLTYHPRYFVCRKPL